MSKLEKLRNEKSELVKRMGVVDTAIALEETEQLMRTSAHKVVIDLADAVTNGSLAKASSYSIGPDFSDSVFRMRKVTSFEVISYDGTVHFAVTRTEL
jgi:hypothetical protein